MNIAEARAFDNGLEFYLHEKNITLNVMRTSTGEIDISTTNYLKGFKREKTSRATKIFALLFAIFFAFLQNFNLHTGYKILLILGIIWIGTFLLYYTQFKNPKKQNSYKYHAAEHKVLNYMDKYNEATDDVYKVMKMSSYSYRCGLTLVAVVYILITLIALGFIFIPGFILKLLWFAFSIYITLYLWANEKCYFFQRFAIIEPDYAEVELAVKGLCEYMKQKHNDC